MEFAWEQLIYNLQACVVIVTIALQLAQHQSHLQQDACRGACLQHGASAAEPTKVMPRQALPLGQVFLDHSLGGDASVVCAWQPQHIVATHAPPPHNGVLDGVGEGMAQMQGACYVGGWDYNDERWLVAV